MPDFELERDECLMARCLDLAEPARAAGELRFGSVFALDDAVIAEVMALP